MPKRDGEQGASGKVSARELAAGVFGRRQSADRVEEVDGERRITISARTANDLLGVGSGPHVGGTPERRLKAQVSGLVVARYNRVAAERERRGLSVAELAQSSGLPVSLVEQLEAADDVTEAHMLALSAGLGLPLAKVFPLTQSGDAGPDQRTFKRLPTPDRGEAADRAEEKLRNELDDARDVREVERIERELSDVQRRFKTAQLRQELTAAERKLR